MALGILPVSKFVVSGVKISRERRQNNFVGNLRKGKYVQNYGGKRKKNE